LRSFVDALHEGFAAYRDYEQLRASGVPHDRAIREALGVGFKPSVAPRALHFAGKA
jgi:hypothetical protein